MPPVKTADDFEFSGQNTFGEVTMCLAFNVADHDHAERIHDTCPPHYILIKPPWRMARLDGLYGPVIEFTPQERAVLDRQVGAIIMHSRDSGFVDVFFYESAVELADHWEDIKIECDPLANEEDE